MSQIFHPSINLIARLSILVVVALAAGLGWLGYYVAASPIVTDVGVVKQQPVPYSHQLHVGQLGLDCRYCHTSVETSNTASIPPTSTCMGCHAQVATDSPALQLVRDSLQNNKPIEWVRVHNLPDYVYFNHAIHVKQGVGCETCHGRVDQMDTVVKTQTMQMNWCLDCHREPEKYIRPRDQVFNMGWQPPTEQAILGKQLVAEHGIQVGHLADCSVCHR